MLELSAREKEVLELYDRGLTHKEIAGRLKISVHSVKAYADRVIIKSVAYSLRHAAWLRRQPAPQPKTPSPARTRRTPKTEFDRRR